MRLLRLAAALGIVAASAAGASDDPVKDTRQILAGTVTTAASKAMYTRGLNDKTKAFLGALDAYKAVRAAEKPAPAPAPVPVPVPTPAPVPVPAPAPSPTPAITWIPCAIESATCTLPGPGTVRFGAGTKFAQRDFVVSTPCTNDVFGDPFPYATKACSYYLTGAPTVPGTPSTPVTPVPTPAPAPTPPAPPSQPLFGAMGERPFNLTPALADIPSVNFDYDKLVPTHNYGIPKTMAPDVVGAFRFQCAAGQLLRDDPMVYPGQPGKSHLHQFFGNLAANANSTYDSLRTSGGSSCEGNPDTPGQAVNRSGYWVPAMLDGKGNVVRPDFVSVYYKRRPISDPICSIPPTDAKFEGTCTALPNGLRFIYGYDMVTSKAATGSAYYNCDGPTAQQGHYGSITEAALHCPTTPTPVKQWDGSFKDTYNRLGMVVMAPDCWNGKDLDSPNHRDHISYMGFDGQTGRYSCPKTHPYLIPAFQLGVWYRVDENLGTWHLSSDEMHPELPPGSTAHADWWGAWDNKVEAMWMDNCINKLLSCSGGDTGNGRHIWGMWGTTEATPRLVPVPQ